MGQAGVETEVKIALSRQEWERLPAQLARLGARRSEAAGAEENLIYDFKDRSLTRAGCYLRLRRWAGRSLLTFKGPLQEDPQLKRRPEWETEVGEAEELKKILQGLGLEVSFQYAKSRESYLMEGSVQICLDDTPVGLYVEIEGPAASIRETAEQLGWGPDRFLRKTYVELYLEHGLGGPDS